MDGVAVVVPVYNEAATVVSVLSRLHSLSFVTQIVVVDDGSTDETAAILAAWSRGRPGVEVVRLPHRGKGAAIRAALPRLRGAVTVFHDADDEYDPADVRKLIRPLIEGSADVVFGTRLAGSVNAFLRFQRAANRVLSAVTRRLFGLAITDMETGAKAFRTGALLGLQLRSDDFAIEPELAARAALAGLRIVEVPISYRARTRREGKKIGWRDAPIALRVLFAIRFADAVADARRGALAFFGARAGAGVAAGIGALTFAVYLIGSSRSYDYDSSETVGSFIATPSLLDPFRRQLVYNNHPLFSSLDHLVYSLGGRSAFDLRLLPILFGASTVAIVAWWCLRRWGFAAAATAAAVLAANPSFAELSRSVRGYSLLCLCAVGSTVLLDRLLRAPSRLYVSAYTLVLAAGIATHVYMLLVLLAHAGVVIARARLNGRWLARWALAVAIGGLAYVDIGPSMVRSAMHSHRLFRPRFPLALLATLFGEKRATLVILGLLACIGAGVLWRRALAVPALLLAGAGLLLWLWLAPYDLYPRFLIWLTPAAALAVAAAVRRFPLTLPLAVAAVVLLVRVDAAHWRQNPLPNEQAAVLVRTTRAHGGLACALPLITGSLLAYTQMPIEVTKATQLRQCQLVLSVPADPPSLRAAAERDFPHHWRLEAWTPMTIFSQLPEARLGTPTCCGPGSA